MKTNFKPLLYVVLTAAAIFAMALGVEQISVDPVTRACSQAINFTAAVQFYGSDLQSSLSSKVPTSTTVNGHALTSNVSVTAADTGAVSTATTVNGHPLSGNVSVTQSDVGLSNVSNVAAGTGSSQLVQRNASAYFPLINSAPSTTSAAGVNFPSGTAPTSPNVGDFWYDGTHLYFNTGTLHDLLSGTVTSVFGKTGAVANIADLAGVLTNDGAGNFSWVAGGSTSDTSYNGSNWTSTTSSPSQRAVAEQIPATPISSLTALENGFPIVAYAAGTGDANTLALLHFDNSWTDSSANSWTVTNAGAALSSAFYKWGGYSAYFDSGSTAAYATLPASTLWNFKSSNWTVEFWVYIVSAGNMSNQAMVSGGTSGTSSYWEMRWTNNGFKVWGNAVYLDPGISFNAGGWHHVVLIVNGGTMSLGLDGNISGYTTTGGVNGLGSVTDPITFGQMGSTWYMDDLRISNVARYTGSTYTVPTNEFGGTAKYDIASGISLSNGTLNYLDSANCTTGSGTALLGTNCPANTVSAPFKWLKATTDDGSVVYIPCWK